MSKHDNCIAECNHNVKYCDKCDEVYCEKCTTTWTTDPCGLNHYYPYTWTFTEPPYGTTTTPIFTNDGTSSKTVGDPNDVALYASGCAHS